MSIGSGRLVRVVVAAVGLIAVAILASTCSSIFIVDPEWVFISDEFNAPIGRRLDESYTTMPIMVDESTTVLLRAKVFETNRSTGQVNGLRLLLSFNLQEPNTDRQIKVYSNRAKFRVNGFPLKIDQNYSKDGGTKLKNFRDWVWAAYEAPLDSIGLKKDSFVNDCCTIDAILDSVIMNGKTPVDVGSLQIYGIKIRKN